VSSLGYDPVTSTGAGLQVGRSDSPAWSLIADVGPEVRGIAVRLPERGCVAQVHAPGNLGRSGQADMTDEGVGVSMG
jgi:hypothetical protein